MDGWLVCVCVCMRQPRERETARERLRERDRAREKKGLFSLFHCDQLSLQLSIVCDTNPSGCLVIKRGKRKKKYVA